jgi:hypothetical protein
LEVWQKEKAQEAKVKEQTRLQNIKLLENRTQRRTTITIDQTQPDQPDLSQSQENQLDAYLMKDGYASIMNIS